MIALVGLRPVVPGILAVEMAYSPPLELQFLLWLPLTLIASLALLQPVKGAIVGLQWQNGMHGFEGSRPGLTNPGHDCEVLNLPRPCGAKDQGSPN